MANNYDTQEASQHLDNRSFNSDFQIYENLIYGYDGTAVRAIKVDATGKLIAQEKPDTTYTWTDGYPTQKVETYSDRTVTTDFTWVSGELTEKDVTVT